MKRSDPEQERIYRGLVFALALVCMVLLVHEIFGSHGYLALRRQRQQFNALQLQIQQLQQENQQLEKQIQGLKSDPAEIEKRAREDMRMARPGETIYTLPDTTAQPQKPVDAGKAPPRS